MNESLLSILLPELIFLNFKILFPSGRSRNIKFLSFGDLQVRSNVRRLPSCNTRSLSWREITSSRNRFFLYVHKRLTDSDLSFPSKFNSMMPKMSFFDFSWKLVWIITVFADIPSRQAEGEIIEKKFDIRTKRIWQMARHCRNRVIYCINNYISIIHIDEKSSKKNLLSSRLKPPKLI